MIARVDRAHRSRFALSFVFSFDLRRLKPFSARYLDRVRVRTGSASSSTTWSRVSSPSAVSVADCVAAASSAPRGAHHRPPYYQRRFNRRTSSGSAIDVVAVLTVVTGPDTVALAWSEAPPWRTSSSQPVGLVPTADDSPPNHRGAHSIGRRPGTSRSRAHSQLIRLLHRPMPENNLKQRCSRPTRGSHRMRLRHPHPAYRLAGR